MLFALTAEEPSLELSIDLRSSRRSCHPALRLISPLLWWRGTGTNTQSATDKRC